MNFLMRGEFRQTAKQKYRLKTDQYKYRNIDREKGCTL